MIGLRGLRRNIRLQVTPQDDAGFAAVDALVALLILSATLVLCLSGLQTADHLSRIAEETGEAARLARSILAVPPSPGDPKAGGSGTLDWTVSEQRAVGVDNVCARTFAARSRRDGRLYQFATARPCG